MSDAKKVGRPVSDLVGAGAKFYKGPPKTLEQINFAPAIAVAKRNAALQPKKRTV
jgi:hypothetical protein